uniref:Neuropeptide-like GPCR n=1 Tax=Tripedalia cystophora TaxID=6141 RepID=A0A481ZQH2_TRICY|nr:neuropeptide-like GPCR [Tripedalia cystophora]
MLQVHNTSKYISPYKHEETVVLSVSLVFIILLSFLGNSVIILTLYKNNKLWISTNILIGNLSFSSLGVSVLVMPFSLYSSLAEEWTFKEGIVCNLTGFSASLLLLVTIFTHTAVSIDKYYGVVKPLSRAFTPQRTWVIVAVIWSVSAAMSLGPLIGVAKFEYNPTTLICGVGFPTTPSEHLYLALLSIIGFVIPTNIMMFVYVRVYMAVRQQAKRLLAHAIVNHEVLQLQKRLILTVFLSWMCFIICWTPFFLLTVLAELLKDRSKLPHALGVAAYWSGYSNSLMYPIIICAMSKRFREGFVVLWRLIVRVPLLVLQACRRNPLRSGKGQIHKGCVAINDFPIKVIEKGNPVLQSQPIALSSWA